MTEALETTTASGRLICHVFGAMAGFKRELIRDYTLAGPKAARARGGHPPTMTPAPLCHIRTMKAAGTAITEIADVLGVSRPTVSRHLEHGVPASLE